MSLRGPRSKGLEDNGVVISNLTKTLSLGTSRWLALLFALTALAAQAQPPATGLLRWSPSNAEDVLGYVVYRRGLRDSYRPWLTTRGATTATITNLQWGTTYFFVVTAFNSAGLESEYSNEVSVRIPYAEMPPVITQQPNNLDVVVAETAVFSIGATGQGVLHYRWRCNGQPLPRTSGATLTLTNVQLSDGGTYDVIVTDAAGSVTSRSAQLTVRTRPLLGKPLILQGPLSQTANALSTVTFSVEVTNTALLPIGYLWLKGEQPLRHRIAYSHADFLTLPQIQLADAACYTIRITNETQPFYEPGFESARACLNVLASNDRDRDGLPDDYELGYGLDPNNAADAFQDPDGDGMSNLDECIAGTDPRDSASFLRVTGAAKPPGILIRFNALANRTYLVQFADDSTSGPWQTLRGVPAISANSSAPRAVEISDAPPFQGRRFYRLVTPATSP